MFYQVSFRDYLWNLATKKFENPCLPTGMLVEKEILHDSLDEVHIVESMHERKALMVQLSDAFIALPGGFGALDELAEILSWNQLKITNKPIALYNINGYFDNLFNSLCI